MNGSVRVGKRFKIDYTFSLNRYCTIRIQTKHPLFYEQIVHPFNYDLNLAPDTPIESKNGLKGMELILLSQLCKNTVKSQYEPSK